MRLHTPRITGSLAVSSSILTIDAAAGNVSGSITSTGSFGSLVVSDKVQGDLTTRDSLTVNKGLTVNDNQEAAYDFIVKSQNKSHTLYADSNKDKVGIGFSSPGGSDLSSSLHIAGDVTTDSHITASGDISVGTMSIPSVTTMSSSVATRFDARETDMTLATASIDAITSSISSLDTEA